MLAVAHKYTLNSKWFSKFSITLRILECEIKSLHGDTAIHNNFCSTCGAELDEETLKLKEQVSDKPAWTPCVVLAVASFDSLRVIYGVTFSNSKSAFRIRREVSFSRVKFKNTECN